jgi:signal recognition particle subunit SEC65
MNLTFLALSISLGLSVIIYLIYKKSSKGYTVQNPVKEPKEDELELIIDELELTIDSSPVLAETVHPETPIKKEVKRKTPKKKAIPQPIVNADELPKAKKSTYKKSYNRKKKDTKKDKGDDLLLS